VRIEEWIIQVLNQLYICDDFDSELKEFKLKMMAQNFYIFGPFLTFLESFIQTKAHNMLAIMLDPQFKNMKIL
jgi:hypothetical protein